MIFYRIVYHDPPTLDDLSPRNVRGPRPARTDPETLRLQSGISVFRAIQQSRSRARRSPNLGYLIAVLDIREGGEIQFERTTASRGHYTLWGDPAILLGCVTMVVAINELS